jgi:hypothetical protein
MQKEKQQQQQKTSMRKGLEFLRDSGESQKVTVLNGSVEVADGSSQNLLVL